MLDVPQTPPLSLAQKAAILHMAAAWGAQPIQIASELLVPLPLVLQHLELAGLRQRQRFDRLHAVRRVSRFAGHPEVPKKWPAERTERLKQLWRAGLSASQIGKQLGISREAVIGKVHRLKLPGRNQAFCTSLNNRKCRRRKTMALSSEAVGQIK